MFGADPKQRGTIHIDGKEVKIDTPQDAIRHGLALIPEERRDQGLVGAESVRKNITLAALKKKFCGGPSWIKQDTGDPGCQGIYQVLRDCYPLHRAGSPVPQRRHPAESGGGQMADE